MPETVLDRLVVRLTVDLKGLTSGLRKATRQITAFTKKVVTIVKKAAKAFRALGTAVAKMARKVKRSAKIAVVALIAMGVAVVKVASDAQESENLFDVALGRMAKDARDWSESVSQSLGLYSTEIRKNLGTFFLMVNSLGVQKEAALEMAKGLTQLTLDMSSFRNQRFDEMFVKLSGAISGEPEPLGRLGVKILEEQLIIWAKLNGLVDQHATKLNQAQKVIARYNLILERTRKDQGDFARTVGNLANQLRILKDQVLELARRLGDTLVPAVTRAVQTMVKWIMANRDTIVAYFQDMIDAAQAFISFFREDWVAGIRKSIELTNIAFVGLAKSLVLIFTTAAIAAADAFMKAYADRIKDGLKRQVFGFAISNVGQFRPIRRTGAPPPTPDPADAIISSDVLARLDAGLKAIAAETKARLAEAFQPVMTGATQRRWKQWATDIVTTIKKTAENFARVSPTLRALFGLAPFAAKDTSQDVFGTLIPGNLGDAGADEAQELEDSFTSAAKNIKTSFQDAFADLILEARTLKEVMVGFFKDIARSILNNISGSIADALTGTRGDPNIIGGIINAGLSIFSPKPLAEGGIVTKPTLAMIGEGRQAEAVIPLDKMGEIGGITINIVNPWDGQSVLRAIDSRAVSAVLRNHGANGPIRTMVQKG